MNCNFPLITIPPETIMKIFHALTSLALGAFISTSAAADDAAMIEAGAETFSTYCATCHGNNLESSGQTFDLRKLRASERGRFQNSVTKGKNQMPPWQGVLSEDEIESVWRYIRANAYEK
jgi:mono/diheme cytochrome c family protein